MTPAFHVSHGCHALVAANVAIRGRNPVGDVSMPHVLTLPHTFACPPGPMTLLRKFTQPTAREAMAPSEAGSSHQSLPS